MDKFKIQNLQKNLMFLKNVVIEERLQNKKNANKTEEFIEALKENLKVGYTINFSSL